MSAFLDDTFHYLVLSLAKVMSVIFERDSYIYWPYLLSSIVIAVVAWRWLTPPTAQQNSWGDFFDKYFGRELWWHRSAQADYWLYVANALLLPLIFAFLILDHRQLAALLRGFLGMADVSGHESAIAAHLAFTVLFFVAYDFGRFVAHCLLHDVPVLWEFHKVHHSAQVLTPMTSFRAHPVELLLMSWGPLVTTGALTVAFNAIVPGRVSFYSFLGVHALLFVSNLIGNLRHSPVWISYGRTWGRWLISPAHHQLHHSYEPRHLGCNRGFELAIWDRLYGTLYVPGRTAEEFRLGLGDGTEVSYHHLGRMYWLPFVRAGEQVSRLVKRAVARLSVR
jgi:sterol desaturase/sphingolipid hydroxylase (fatty acid hydroxylase superfamily)